MAEYDDPEDQIVPDKNCPPGTKIMCVNISSEVENHGIAFVRRDLVVGKIYTIESWNNWGVTLKETPCGGYFPERFVLA